jgi:hypothetical protein
MSREAFEKWYAREFKRLPNNDWHETYIAWEAWQAALQSGEPVAWISEEPINGPVLHRSKSSALRFCSNPMPLYTNPQPMVPEWISVDERLPEEETPVLAIVDGYDGLLTVERRWERCDQMTEPYYKDFLYWDWVDNDGQDLEGKVRFWMRLPEMPALQSAGKGGE